MSETLPPFRLKPLLVERVWGYTDLNPWYPVRSEKAIGEAWLSGDECVVETGPLSGRTLAQAVAEGRLTGAEIFTETERSPLLIKMLFPREKLSVQVHPDDADAARLGHGTEAKTECWYVLQAEPDASVAMGLKPGTPTAAVQAAIGDGSLESLLEYPRVAAGDMVYVSAGTVHAILPGVVILEIQQNSDTTYRLYDYGRPRELHLERGLDVLKLATDAGKFAAKEIDGGTQLIAVPHFTVERYGLSGKAREFQNRKGEYLVTLRGGGVLSSWAGNLELVAGELVVVPASTARYALRGDAEVVRSFVG